MKYKIALQHSKEGCSALVPGLPGCCSQGSTEQEAVASRTPFGEYLEVRDRLLKVAVVREVEIAWPPVPRRPSPPQRGSSCAC